MHGPEDLGRAAGVMEYLNLIGNETFTLVLLPVAADSGSDTITGITIQIMKAQRTEFGM